MCAVMTLYESGLVSVILFKDIQIQEKIRLVLYRNFQCDVLLESEKHMFRLIASSLAFSLESHFSLRHRVQATSLESGKF